MRVEKHQYPYVIQAHFPNLHSLTGFEGRFIWLAERDGRFYLILDEGSMAEFLTPGTGDYMEDEQMKVYEFDTETEREKFVKEQAWRNRG